MPRVVDLLFRPAERVKPLNEKMPFLACPKCHGSLSFAVTDEAVCGCGWHFRVVDGVFDLRCRDSKTSALFEKDEERADILRTRADALSFDELVRLCYELPGSRTPSALDVSVRFMLDGENRMEANLRSFSKVAQRAGWEIPRGGCALEVGSGVGLTTGALARHFDHVFGINPAHDEVVVAQRANRDRFENCVCFALAFGEHLPFPPETFDFVIATDVLEHVTDPARVLLEAERVLKPNGIVAMDSPNRFNVFTPDGHVHLKYVGFLPEALREPYVRWRTGASWRMRNIRPLSYGRLRRCLEGLRACDYHLDPDSRFVEHQRETLRSKAAAAVPRLSRWIGLRVGPAHNFVVRRKPD
jgi:SAM-dependent methyltransferase